MRLKEIKLAGFKSFVDPTTVVLPGNRSAVVGPNGCGKSNIVDAVRWVMGESSARQLRGEALTDVIFNGSTSRQPTSLASIELLFDNRDGRAGGQLGDGRFASYAEIAVRREVSRDAQSVYSLNGSRCRRRDIADVFLGTGFGPRSYSIIEQGMISELVEAKPEALRAYLEEAAGISKYKERRRETQNRIGHTVENLERLADIRDELERRLAHLKRQAQAAQRYRELKEEERQRTAELYAIRLAAAGLQLQEREARAKTLAVEHAHASSQRQAVETALEQGRAAHAKRGDELSAVQKRYYDFGASVSSLEEAIRFDRERVDQLGRDIQALASRQQEAAAQLDADTARIADLKERIAAGKPALARGEADDGAAVARLDDVEGRVRVRQRAWEDFRNRVADNDRETHIQQSRIEHGEQVLRSLHARTSRLDAEPAIVVDADIEELSRQIDESQRRAAALAAAVAANGQGVADARQQLVEREQDRDEARDEAQHQRRELAALAAVQEAALGRDASSAQAVARWVNDRGLRTAPRLGEQLTVEAGWEEAVEAVLGSHIQALMVDDTAALALKLDSLESGRVTLAEARPAVAASGIPPALADFVGGDPGALLAGVFAADSLSDALQHRSSLVPGQSIVTRDGIWLGVDWVRLDKGMDESDSVLRRARELEARQAVAAAAEARQAEHDKAVAQGRRQLAIQEEERESLQRRNADAVAELSRRKTEHDVRRVRMEEAGARVRRNAAERKEVAAQIHAESGRLEGCRARLVEFAVASESLRTEGDRLRALREDDASELEHARRSAREARDAYHRRRAEFQSLQASLAASETTRNRLLAQRRDLETRAEEHRTAIAEIQDAVPGRQADLEAKLAERLAVERQLVDLRRQMATIETEIRTLTGRRIEAEQQAETIRAQLESARLERERLAAERDNLSAQLAETGISLEAAQAGLPEHATDARWMEALANLERRIARLGPINLAAIDEYDMESERKLYLDRQYADLEAALATLRNAIRRIDRDTRTRFKDTFGQVNEHLKTLFPKVFGGGHAYLELTGENWLDTGVALMARPPGKRNSSIHLLSGGEKAMTAVALIFSIFQLNPSPVCLLDEVDASLDDTNVGRFADLIHDMSSEVQFVVITHNKQTIEMADHLLGVTMQEAGVSRLVTVDVEKAARMAAAG